jgi:hypothetical protein
MHQKKEKGDIGLAYAIARVTELGWSVCLSIKEHTKYDLIAEKNGVCKRIQVRYTTPHNGVMAVKLRSIWSDKNGVHSRLREEGDFDILAVFCPTTKSVFFIKDEEFENGTAISLRLEPSKNNQKKNVRMAEDFTTI